MLKRLFYVVTLLLASANLLFAQSKSNRTALRIQLDDGNPLTVTINDRDYKKVGKSITIGDIPRKRNYIKVYRIRPYSDGQGAKAELAYSGKLKLEKGKKYDAVVNWQQRKIRLKKVAQYDALPASYQPSLPSEQYRNDQPISTEDTDNASSLSPELFRLYTEVEQIPEDSKKVEQLKKHAQQNGLSTEQVKTLSSWLLFDDSKLEFVKSAFPKVSNKQQFASLVNIFSLEESKQDFLNFLQSQD